MKRIFLLPVFVIELAICGCKSTSIQTSKYSMSDLVTAINEIIEEQENQYNLFTKDLTQFDDISSYKINYDYSVAYQNGLSSSEENTYYQTQEFKYDKDNNIGSCCAKYYAPLKPQEENTSYFRYIDGDYEYKTYSDVLNNGGKTSSKKYYYKTALDTSEKKEQYKQEINTEFKARYYSVCYYTSLQSFLDIYNEAKDDCYLYSLNINKISKGNLDFSAVIQEETSDIDDGEYLQGYFYMSAKIKDYKIVYCNFELSSFKNKYNKETDIFELDFQRTMTLSIRVSDLDEKITHDDLSDYEDKSK